MEISSHQVQLLTEIVLDFKQVATDEVAIHFVDLQTICALHEKHFNDPSPTDCISFPIDSPGESSENHHILGEVFICPEVAIQYANFHETDSYQELTLYLIHGLLHLLGYDDQRPEEEKIMREEEKKCMQVVREKNVFLRAKIAS